MEGKPTPGQWSENGVGLRGWSPSRPEGAAGSRWLGLEAPMIW